MNRLRKGTMYQTLISAQVLQKEGQDFIIFDCRSYLTEPDKGLQLYREGHIPGAFFLDMESDLSSPVTPESGRHPLPDFERLQVTLLSAGVTGQAQVVVYDDMAGAMAARLWWLLRYMGHEKVAVLDGGYPAWLEAGEVGKVSESKALDLLERDPALWAVVVAPWVLIQERA